jgi:hypothetical protein
MGHCECGARGTALLGQRFVAGQSQKPSAAPKK